MTHSGPASHSQSQGPHHSRAGFQRLQHTALGITVLPCPRCSLPVPLPSRGSYAPAALSPPHTRTSLADPCPQAGTTLLLGTSKSPAPGRDAVQVPRHPQREDKSPLLTQPVASLDTAEALTSAQSRVSSVILGSCTSVLNHRVDHLSTYSSVGWIKE